MTDTPKTKAHKRVNDILLGPLERPALQWLAAHMPGWVTPDTLTVIGIIGAVMVFGGYWLSCIDRNFLWLSNLGFMINWFGDSLDGTLARHRGIQRPTYGFFVDHTVDALSEVLIFLGLGLSPYVRFEVACLALIGYLLMSILVYVRTYSEGVFKISYAKLGPTEMRLMAMIANTFIYFVGNPVLELPFGTVSVYDLFGMSIAAALGVAFVVSTIKQARKFAKLDPVKSPGGNGVDHGQ